MTMTTETWSDYGYWTDFLNGRAHRKVANNTYARLEDDGRIVVKYHDTDILTFFPNGEVEYQSGGWLTYTTKDRFNRFGAHGVQISQDKGRWYLYRRGDWHDVVSDYYDGMRVKDGQLATGIKHTGDPDKKIKAAIDRYVKLYTDEKVAEMIAASQEAALGDCWYCQMRVSGTGVPLGEHTGDHDHLLQHVKESYVQISTIYNAVVAAGYRVPAVILHGNCDMARRALRRYLRQRLATHTAGAAGGSKPISQGFG